MIEDRALENTEKRGREHGDFRYVLRVHYADTDAGGAVYHANYLTFAERARSEALSELGFGVRRLIEEFDLVWVVREATIRYRKPARLDDVFVVLSRCRRCSSVRFAFTQHITRNEELLASVQIDLAAIFSNGKLRRELPAEVSQALDAAVS